MTIGIDRLRSASNRMKEAIALVREEMQNPDLKEQVKIEVKEVFEDLQDNVVHSLDSLFAPEPAKSAEPEAVADQSPASAENVEPASVPAAEVEKVVETAEQA